VVALTQLVLPLMRQAGRGRVVTVTTVGGVVGQPFADPYCGAKFAVEGFKQFLAPVAERFGVGITVVEPGAVASEFVANVAGADPGGDAQAHDDAYSLLRSYLDRTAATFANAQTAEAAATVIVEAATTHAPRFRWQTSEQAVSFAGLSLADLEGERVLAQTRQWIS